jgi:hypothetical protein
MTEKTWRWESILLRTPARRLARLVPPVQPYRSAEVLGPAIGLSTNGAGCQRLRRHRWKTPWKSRNRDRPEGSGSSRKKGFERAVIGPAPAARVSARARWSVRGPKSISRGVEFAVHRTEVTPCDPDTVVGRASDSRRGQSVAWHGRRGPAGAGPLRGARRSS